MTDDEEETIRMTNSPDKTPLEALGALWRKFSKTGNCRTPSREETTAQEKNKREMRIIAKLPLLAAVLVIAMSLLSSPWHLTDWLYGVLFGLMIGWSIHLHGYRFDHSENQK